MSEKLRLCIIGAGGHSSRNIYPCFRFLKNAEVAANCDLRLDRAKLIAERHGILSSYKDYHEMIEAEEPDGVIVCVNADFHVRSAIEIMEMGYNVYTEKPPAKDAVQCRQVMDVHHRTGKICMTAFKKRYAPAYQRAKKIIDSKDFGKPMLLQFLRTSGGSRPNYITRGEVHAIDLINYFFGKVRIVSAYKHPLNTSAVSLEFVNGAVGTLAFTDNLKGKRKWEQVTLIGDKDVCIKVDNSVEMTAFKEGTPFDGYKPDFSTGSCHSSIEMGFVGELQEFVDCIREERTPRSSIEYSYHAMCIIDAILESLETRQSVSVEDV